MMADSEDFKRPAAGLPAWIERARQAWVKNPPQMSDEERAEIEEREAANIPGSEGWQASMRAGNARAAGCSDEEVLRLIREQRWPEPPGGSAHTQRAMRAVKALLTKSDPMRSLALLGPPGVGKTVAAFVACGYVPGSVFVDAVDVSPGPEWDDIRKRAKQTELLVLNDPDPRKPWACAEMEQMLASRHDKGKKTILTANWMPTKAMRLERDFGDGLSIEEAFGARDLSRLGWKLEWTKPPKRTEPTTQGWVLVLGGRDLRGGA